MKNADETVPQLLKTIDYFVRRSNTTDDYVFNEFKIS